MHYIHLRSAYLLELKIDTPFKPVFTIIILVSYALYFFI